MRYSLTVKAILAICLTLICICLYAAQYRDGQLYIEVLLCSGSVISLSSAGGNPVTVSFSEPESPVSRSISTPLNIVLEDSGTLALWSILERVEPWSESSNGVLRETFVWKDSTLMIRQENLVFAENTYADKAAALRYSKAAGISEKQIQSLPLVNSTVCISGSNGSRYYLETPLHLTASSPLFLGGVKLGFSGEFILKNVNGKLVATHFLPLEDYVAGVIPNEIGSNAPMEAMKAQAVTARTHAVSLLLYNRHKNDGYDLCNTTHCQVYKGQFEQNEATRAAVVSTQNQILTFNGRIADATYHSACGGKTDSSKNIWDGDSLPYLNGVVCSPGAEDFDLSTEADVRRWISEAPAANGGSLLGIRSLAWSKQLPLSQLAQNLDLSYIDHILIGKRGNSGRITDITFYGEKTVRLTSEYKIRQAFGSAKSSFFYIAGGYVEDDHGQVLIYPGATMLIKGRGSGHGVGMCQVGALRKAREGEDYMKILTHYYPGTKISTDWMDYEQR